MKPSAAARLLPAMLVALGFLLALWRPADAQGKPVGKLVVLSRPPGAYVVLDGQVRVEAVAPFTVDRGLSGPYQVRAGLAGHHAWRSQVVLSGSRNDTLSIELSPLRRSGAVLRSAIIPGWGQRYLERKRAASLLFWSEAAIGAAAAYEHSRYSSAMDDYRGLRDAYSQAGGNDGIRAAYAAMQDEYGKARDRRDRRNALLWTGAAVWGVGLLDALVNGPAYEPGTRGLSFSASAARRDPGELGVAFKWRF